MTGRRCSGAGGEVVCGRKPFATRGRFSQRRGTLLSVQVCKVFLFAALIGCSGRRDLPDVYVGIAKQTFVAVVVDSECANAYVTDGRDGWASVWSRMETRPGEGFGGEGLLHFQKEGVTLTLSRDELKGKLTLPTSMSDFEVELVEEPSGVYIASATVAGAQYLGTWIFTSAGEQRGAVLAGSELSPSWLSGPEQAQIVLEDGVPLDVGRVTVPTCTIPTGTTGGGVTSAGTSAGGGDGGGGGNDGGLCCMMCGAKSKPCGDGCISLDKMCHQDPGCACEG